MPDRFPSSKRGMSTPQSCHFRSQCNREALFLLTIFVGSWHRILEETKFAFHMILALFGRVKTSTALVSILSDSTWDLGYELQYVVLFRVLDGRPSTALHTYVRTT